jgi:hypothetical protein
MCNKTEEAGKLRIVVEIKIGYYTSKLAVTKILVNKSNLLLNFREKQ